MGYAIGSEYQFPSQICGVVITLYSPCKCKKLEMLSPVTSSSSPCNSVPKCDTAETASGEPDKLLAY